MKNGCNLLINGGEENIEDFLRIKRDLPKEYREILEKHDVLLNNIKQKLPELESLLNDACGRRGKFRFNEEEMVYRFYHESWKVYWFQGTTKSMYLALEEISPHEKDKIRDPHYLRIINEGASGKEWKKEDNKNWDSVCRPFLEAFFHSKYFLEMAVKYGKELEKAPRMLPYGWAALLELYGIR